MGVESDSIVLYVENTPWDCHSNGIICALLGKVENENQEVRMIMFEKWLNIK